MRNANAQVESLYEFVYYTPATKQSAYKKQQEHFYMSKDPPNDEGTGTPTGDVAIIGDEAGKGTPVSMQLIQDIYNEFTGKTEEITQTYKKPFQASISDLEQLNAKIHQLQEQYSICSKNCSVTIYYLHNTRETFSSFERFKLYDASRLSPIESVLLKYSFLIKLPSISRLQNYTLSIRLGSRITAMKKLKQETPFPDFIPFRAFVMHSTATVSINYVDYLVARNFQDSIRDWIDGLEEKPFSKAFRLFQKKSHYIPILTKYSLSGFLLSLILIYLPKFPPAGSLDLNAFGKFLLLAFSILFIGFRLAEELGEVSERAIDNFLEISYLKLNKGDEREIQSTLRQNRGYTVRAIFGIIGTLVLGILASLIAGMLLH